MEDALNPEAADAAEARACVNCGLPPLENPSHATPLCHDCRQKFVKFPIPLWIWVFAAVILAIVLIGLFRLPADISLGIGLEKGIKAAEERKFMTAEQELKRVADKLPTDVEANGRLLIAAFYNDHFDLFSKQVGKLQHLKFENQELFQEVDQVMTAADIMVSTDSFKIFSQAHPDPAHTPDTAWFNYFSSNPSDNDARLEYVNYLFDSKRYASCDSVGSLILEAYPGDFRMLMLAASSKREQGQYDSALFYNERMLALNRESVHGLASEARTLLRLKQDERALKAALKAVQLEPEASYAQASLILAYHFNGRTSDRDALITEALRAAKDSSDRVSVQYALDVISKKEKFRD
jgi:tetratricopeptide (TPR) repeat protein